MNGGGLSRGKSPAGRSRSRSGGGRSPDAGGSTSGIGAVVALGALPGLRVGGERQRDQLVALLEPAADGRKRAPGALDRGAHPDRAVGRRAQEVGCHRARAAGRIVDRQLEAVHEDRHHVAAERPAWRMPSGRDLAVPGVGGALGRGERDVVVESGSRARHDSFAPWQANSSEHGPGIAGCWKRSATSSSRGSTARCSSRAEYPNYWNYNVVQVDGRSRRERRRADRGRRRQARRGSSTGAWTSSTLTRPRPFAAISRRRVGRRPGSSTCSTQSRCRRARRSRSRRSTTTPSSTCAVSGTPRTFPDIDQESTPRHVAKAVSMTRDVQVIASLEGGRAGRLRPARVSSTAAPRSPTCS